MSLLTSIRLTVCRLVEGSSQRHSIDPVILQPESSNRSPMRMILFSMAVSYWKLRVLSVALSSYDARI